MNCKLCFSASANLGHSATARWRLGWGADNSIQQSFTKPPFENNCTTQGEAGFDWQSRYVTDVVHIYVEMCSGMVNVANLVGRPVIISTLK